MNHTLHEYYSYSYKEKEGEMMCEKERKNDRRQIVVTVKETDGMVRGREEKEKKRNRESRDSWNPNGSHKQ